jgi:plasmid stabilization system protein ParE
MSYVLRLLPDAQAEYDEAAEWYEQQQPGLGVDFVAKVGDVFARIERTPRMHGKVYGEVRKAVVRRFPYIVLYQEDGAEVIVISVFHTSRDPNDWQSRVDGE